MNDHWAVHSDVPVEDKVNHYPIAWAVMLLNGRRVGQRDGKEPRGSFFRSRTSRSENERKRRRIHAEEISRLARGMVGTRVAHNRDEEGSQRTLPSIGRGGVLSTQVRQDEKERPDSPQPRNQP